MTVPIDPLATGVPVVLRRVRPPAAPWPAGIVRTASGPGLLVDVAELSDCALGPSAEHVARPSEVFRTADGHLALLPGLSRPLVAGALPPGPAVTLAVSVLRGMREAGAGAVGRWWLADDGAPMFVPVRGGDDVSASGAALVRALADSVMPEVFAELAAELEEVDDLDDVAVRQWEDRLFRAAEPEPVVRPVLEEPSPRRRRAESTRPAGSPLLRAFDAGLAAAVLDAAGSFRRRLRGVRGRRAPMLIVATAVALVVLVIGLGWPEGEDRPVAGPVASASAPQNAQPVTARPSVSASGAGHDLVSIARDLLSRLRSCGDPGCRSGVLEDPTAALAEGVALRAADAALTLLDDLGGIAVLRADVPGRGSQIVIMVARDDSWLVRDVYDAADQP